MTFLRDGVGGGLHACRDVWADPCGDDHRLTSPATDPKQLIEWRGCLLYDEYRRDQSVSGAVMIRSGI